MGMSVAWARGDEAVPTPAQGQIYLGKGRSLEAGAPLLPWVKASSVLTNGCSGPTEADGGPH